MSAPFLAPPRRKRPHSVNYFALAVLYLGVVNLVRAWLALGGQPFIETLPLTMPLPYLAACSIVWGIVFAVAALGLWRLWPWARPLLLGAIVIYQLHIWVNHWILDRSDYARQVWPFEIGISIASIMVIWGYLFLPGIRRLYSKTCQKEGT